jgi:betaine-aldehyde dehydrogenase
MLMHDPWIDGRTVADAGWARIVRTSPSDGTQIASVAAATAETVAAAVASARIAFDARIWADMPGSARDKALSRMADLMERDLDTIARLEAVEAGKTIAGGRGETEWGIELLRYGAALAWNLSGKAFSDGGPDNLGLVLHHPRGVVGMITPWNFPIVTLMQKLPYALAAGCSVVVKPSEMTSGTTLMARLASEAGVPPGVFNVVTGEGSVVGEAMSTHPGIDMMSFTGSTAVGRRIARHAADRIRPVALELGGKGANIVFADADLDAAVKGAVAGFTINKGEECCAGSRLLVQESIAEDFGRRVAEAAARVRLGTGENADMGPLISAAQMEKVLAYIQSGVDQGARLLTGGKRMTEGGLAGGNYVAPTVFVDALPGMRIVDEEIFGPVTAIIPFKDAADAICIANSTGYGLANGVWTSNLDTAMAVVRRLRGGTTYVNTYLETAPQLPFGGIKDSGLGRENGIEGLSEFLETRAAFIRLKAS